MVFIIIVSMAIGTYACIYGAYLDSKTPLIDYAFGLITIFWAFILAKIRKEWKLK